MADKFRRRRNGRTIRAAPTRLGCIGFQAEELAGEGFPGAADREARPGRNRRSGCGPQK